MPVATELTKSLLQWQFFVNDHYFQAWVNSLHDRIQRMSAWAGEATSDAPNIEQLFDYAPFDRERDLMEQHLCDVGRHDGTTPYGRASSIQFWLHRLQSGLIDLLLEKQKGAEVVAIRPFEKQLRPDDAVLTFNYDTILETAVGTDRWSHGFAEEQTEGRLPILKLHGSIDWWMFPRDSGPNGSGWQLLFKKIDLNREQWIRDPDAPDDAEPEYRFLLWRAQDIEVAKQAYRSHDGASINAHPIPGVGGLGSYKPLHQLIGSGEVWQRARMALREAKEVYVIGWSCSEYDRLARLYFAETLASREAPPERIDIIAPNASAKANINRYKSVFRNPRPIDWRVEDVNWAEFLSTAG